MPSRYDDELWQTVPDERAEPEPAIANFVHALPRATRALDLGCGDGRLTALIPAARLTAADVSPVALERARSRLPAGVELAELEPGAPLPFADSTFDLVLCAETIEHVQDVQSLLSEVRRVLAPGGVLALTTPAHSRLTGIDIAIRGFERRFDPLSPHLRSLTRRSLRALLDEMGFDVVTLRRRSGTLLATARR